MKVIKKVIAALMGSALVLSSFSAIPVKAAEEDNGRKYKVEGFYIDEAHFPDDNFRACVAVNSDKDGNGYLDEDEIFETWNLYCENSEVESVKGIEYFPYLKGLWCKGNKITKLDLSGNPDLEGVWCSFNPLTELDFSPCPKLAWVYCFNCKLKKLNFEHNPKLAYLECNANPDLREVDVTHNPELENLFCSECALTELNVSKNPLLCELTCFKNKLKTLDVSHNPLIKRLDVWDNEELVDIDVSNLKEMQYYNIGNTAAKYPNIKNNKHLLEFVCNYNEGVTSLDLSNNPELAYLALECDVNLKSLDISHNPKLYYLLAFGLSSIESIDLSKNYRLCKAYNEGTYVHETEKLGFVYSMTLDYGGSSDPFDELRHCVALDDRITGSKVNAKFSGKNVPDSRIDTNDGLSDSETFITRGQAIQTLYELAGKPGVHTGTRFTDVPSDASYYDAVRWGEANNICFGYPVLCDNKFSGEELINRQDWAIMAHRFADVFKLGTALDYGRSDWYRDSLDMDFYAWAPFTWALQWKVVYITDESTHCLPHGRITYDQFLFGLENLLNLDAGASYAQRVGGNFGAEGDPNATQNQGTGYYGDHQSSNVDIVIPTTYPGSGQVAFEEKQSANAQGSKDSQDSKNTQDSKESQDSKNTPDSKDAQSSKDSQTSDKTNSTSKTNSKNPTTKPAKNSSSQKQETTSKNNEDQKLVAPTKTSLSSVKNIKKRKLAAKWKKVKDAEGYQVEYALNSRFTKNKKSKTIKGNTTKSLSFTSSRLKKSKVYYVRVRAYKTDVNGKKVYGKWSSVKKVKIKK